jgi:hypothetical protein
MGGLRYFVLRLLLKVAIFRLRVEFEGRSCLVQFHGILLISTTASNDCSRSPGDRWLRTGPLIQSHSRSKKIFLGSLASVSQYFTERR